MSTATLTTSHNFLAGPYIDRRSESREEADWRAAAVSDPGTLFLLARGTAHPIGGEHPSVTFVRADDPAVRSAALESWVLLGWYREARCVLVQLGEDVPPPPGARFEEGAAIARISAVGAGMPCTPGTAARMFRCLADVGINIELIATSEIRTSCVVAEADGVRALQAVHAAFGLGGAINHRAEGTEAPV
jgi:hypothetical protein